MSKVATTQAIARELGPFHIDSSGYVWGASEKGGSTVIAQIQMRGWGYLTGGGSGALGLSDDVASATQEVWRNMICDALNSYAGKPDTKQARADD